MDRGEWIQTFSGRKFWPLDPKPEDVVIEDIAHALSLKCRFGGHCLQFYSVAEHSVRVSHQVDAEYELWALLHDAAETYLADIVRPVKRSPVYAGVRACEEAVMRSVCARFGLASEEPQQVKVADYLMLAVEHRDLMAAGPPWSDIPAIPANFPKIEPMPAVVAEKWFLQRFRALAKGVEHGYN